MPKTNARTLMFAILLALTAGEAIQAANDYIFPQVADGAAGAIALRTRFTMQSWGTVTLRFFQPDGAPMPMTLTSPEIPELNGTAATFTYTNSEAKVLTCLTSGLGALKTGWAKIQSDFPMQVISCGYCLYGTGTPNPPMDWEVAVPPTKPETIAYLETVLSQNDPLPGQSTDLSFAVANPHGYPIDIYLHIEQGTRTLTVPANGQVSLYLKQLYSGADFGTRYVDRARFLCMDTFCLMGLRAVAHPVRSVYSYLPITSGVNEWRETCLEREPNNDKATAMKIGYFPALVLGSFTGAEDVDAWWFHLQAGDEVHIAVLTDLLGLDRNTTGALELWNSTARLAEGVSLPWSVNDRYLHFTAPTDGDYWVYVSGAAGPSSPGDYQLYVKKQAVPVR